jgi:hypothetical protein
LGLYHCTFICVTSSFSIGNALFPFLFYLQLVMLILSNPLKVIYIMFIVSWSSWSIFMIPWYLYEQWFSWWWKRLKHPHRNVNNHSFCFTWI